MITQICHKKNELFKVEYFQDEECTVPFDFTNAKNLYIQPVNGDCTPIFALSHKLSGLGIKARIFTPIWHLGWYDGISPQTPVVTLNDVLCNDELKNVNLSKYIPKDNAVLFLSEEDRNQYDYNDNLKFRIVCQDSIIPDSWKLLADKSSEITIFLPHGTQSEIQKAEEVGKYLWENFGIKPNLCALHWFGSKYEVNAFEIEYLCEDFGILSNINKIITTNSTGILKPEDSNECLQVIDCKEIFEEYLKENN